MGNVGDQDGLCYKMVCFPTTRFIAPLPPKNPIKNAGSLVLLLIITIPAMLILTTASRLVNFISRFYHIFTIPLHDAFDHIFVLLSKNSTFGCYVQKLRCTTFITMVFERDSLWLSKPHVVSSTYSSLH